MPAAQMMALLEGQPVWGIFSCTHSQLQGHLLPRGATAWPDLLGSRAAQPMCPQPLALDMGMKPPAWSQPTPGFPVLKELQEPLSHQVISTRQAESGCA